MIINCSCSWLDLINQLVGICNNIGPVLREEAKDQLSR